MIGADELNHRFSEVRPQTERRATHEIGCGEEDVLMDAVDIATDVNNLVTKENAGCNTAKVTMQDQINNTYIETHNMAS